MEFIVKSSKELNQIEIYKIKKSMAACFGHGSVTISIDVDYALLKKNDDVPCSATLHHSDNLIANLCTDPNYRKQGCATKLINSITKYKAAKNPYRAIHLFTEKNTKGIIPKQIYLENGWIDKLENSREWRNNMFYLPQTGILPKSKIINTKILETMRSNMLINQFINFSNKICSYCQECIVDNNDILSENFNNVNYKFPSQILYSLKNNIGEHKLFNHVLFIEDTIPCLFKLNKLISNFHTNSNFLIIIYYNKEILIIQKVDNNDKFITNCESEQLNYLIDFFKNPLKLKNYIKNITSTHEAKSKIISIIL
jgi:hypothetical protein